MSLKLRIAAVVGLLAGSHGALAYNVLKNGDFSGSIANWNTSAIGGGFVGYESVAGSPAGGSLRLESFGDNESSHADQCIDIHKWFALDFSLRKFNEAEGGTGTHPFRLDVYDAASCSGNILSTITLPEAGDSFDCSPTCWIEVSVLGTPLPSGALSAKVNLDAIAGPAGYSYYLIDHVQVVPPDEIFPEDFEGG